MQFGLIYCRPNRKPQKRNISIHLNRMAHVCLLAEPAQRVSAFPSVPWGFLPLLPHSTWAQRQCWSGFEHRPSPQRGVVLLSYQLQIINWWVPREEFKGSRNLGVGKRNDSRIHSASIWRLSCLLYLLRWGLLILIGRAEVAQAGMRWLRKSCPLLLVEVETLRQVAISESLQTDFFYFSGWKRIDPGMSFTQWNLWNLDTTISAQCILGF